MNGNNSKYKPIIIVAGILVFLAIIIIVVSTLMTQSNQKAQAATAAALTVAQAETESAIPTFTPTAVPTSEPSPTATLVPTAEPTLTALPTFGLVENGVEMWTIPQDAGVISVGTLASRNQYLEVKIGYEENGMLNVQVPGSYVVVEAHFNQALPSGSKVQIIELGSITPWYDAPLMTVNDDGNTGIALINHPYVINPPFWEITYHMQIISGTGEVFWESDVRIFKAIPNTCWNGSLPNPVTLYCPNYDGDWNYADFENFNPNADIFTSGQVLLPERYK